MRQQCTGTILDDGVGSDMGCGCFLVLRGEGAAGECVFLVYSLTQKLRSSRLWRLRRGHRYASVHGGLLEDVLSWVSSSRCAHLENGALFLYGLVSGSHASCVLALHVECKELEFSDFREILWSLGRNA